MNTFKLSDYETWAVINALRVAAETYGQNAETARNSIVTAEHGQQYARLEQQFRDQATEALRIATKLEDSQT